jgi:4a-hydroxytetrahydrobiopterin dehydratase
MWTEREDGLYRDFRFSDFTMAFTFMMEIAFAAEQQQHHPNWSNVYNTVSIKLNTHDAGGTVTEKDRKLADTIDHIAKRYQ